MRYHTIYKSKQGKAILHQHYDKYVDSLGVEVERRYVPTRFGRTHVLQLGPEGAKPLMILQGGNCVNPMTLSWFAPLFRQYRIYAPDTIGHPGYSDETRLSGKDHSLAVWLSDVMVELGLTRSAWIGPSFGAGMVLRLAAHMPEKIACAALIAPAGIRLGDKSAMIRQILLPLIRYRLGGNPKHLNRIAEAMSLGGMKETDKSIIGHIFRYVKLEQDMPKLSELEELTGYRAPTLLIAGNRDIFFPGDRVISRAKDVIPNLMEAKLLDMGHFPSDEMLRLMNKEIQVFLEQTYLLNEDK
ncbi:alpha/beta fold hydrolase [Paenibacillus chartarius]|uniref:Alpha/beta fold hydrolase n=1 Tax=Paenibacillus chartarius TaxID=747481 RepID=A0ABV6DEA4_9BACL